MTTDKQTVQIEKIWDSVPKYRILGTRWADDTPDVGDPNGDTWSALSFAEKMSYVISTVQVKGSVMGDSFPGDVEIVDVKGLGDDR